VTRFAEDAPNRVLCMDDDGTDSDDGTTAEEPKKEKPVVRRRWGSHSGYEPPKAYSSSGRRISRKVDHEPDWDE